MLRQSSVPGESPSECRWTSRRRHWRRIAASCAGVLLPGSGADIDPEKYGEQPIAACAAKDPAREAADELLLQDAFNLQKPIFGICYGLQSLNVWRNGTLIQDLPQALAVSVRERNRETMLADHAAGRTVLKAHPVTLCPGSRLAAILADASDVEHTTDFSRISVNSSHHQAVGRPWRSATDGGQEPSGRRDRGPRR